MDGIYVAYVTGSQGYSAILFVLRDGRLTGADVGGGTYSGSYQTLPDRLVGTATATMAPNGQLITGAAVGAGGTQFSVPFEIRIEDVGQGYIVLQTPAGPVSAAIKKLQEV